MIPDTHISLAETTFKTISLNIFYLKEYTDNHSRHTCTCEHYKGLERNLVGCTGIQKCVAEPPGRICSEKSSAVYL